MTAKYATTRKEKKHFCFVPFAYFAWLAVEKVFAEADENFAI
jgi:hypothetical protein